MASYNKGNRDYWIEHCIVARKIAEHMGRELSSPCVCNIWIPDGLKDIPIDRKAPRDLLKQSLDAIFAEKMSRKYRTRLVRTHDVFQKLLKHHEADTFCGEPVHPNRVGHLAIAEAVYAALSR